MVESADTGQRNDAAALWWCDGARIGSIFLKGEVRARAVVVAEIAAETPKEMSLVQDDHMVEELAADRADHALGERVLPGRTRCGEDLGDADALHPSAKLGAVDTVTITEQVARRRVIGERLDDLLRGPGGGIRHVEVHDSAATMQ